MLETREALASLLLRAERYAEAESVLLSAYEELLQDHAAEQSALPRLRQKLVELYGAWGVPERARELPDSP